MMEIPSPVSGRIVAPLCCGSAKQDILFAVEKQGIGAAVGGGVPLRPVVFRRRRGWRILDLVWVEKAEAVKALSGCTGRVRICVEFGRKRARFQTSRWI